jgi:Ran GTPase-activating protein (RanGAP) involved in mRNA processing and transport
MLQKQVGKSRTLKLVNLQLGRESSHVVKKLMIMCSDHFANYDLSDNCLGDDGAMLLAEALKSSLHIVSLNLSSNSLTHKGAHFIFEAL